MERWVIDILGFLFLIFKKNMCLMVVGDYFIKWIDVIFVKNKNVVIMGNKCIIYIVVIFGV